HFNFESTVQIQVYHRYVPSADAKSRILCDMSALEFVSQYAIRWRESRIESEQGGAMNANAHGLKRLFVPVIHMDAECFEDISPHSTVPVFGGDRVLRIGAVGLLIPRIFHVVLDGNKG